MHSSQTARAVVQTADWVVTLQSAFLVVTQPRFVSTKKRKSHIRVVAPSADLRKLPN